MNVLWFTWKDMTHPWAGGAELVNERLAKRMVADGHEVTLLVGGYPGCKPEEMIDGYRIIRVGGFYSVFWHAFRYYRKYLKEWPDLIIEGVNTMPFFTRFYAKQAKVLFYYQLCREVWFYQMKQPFASIGYLLEPLYWQLLRGMKAITESDSSRQDLVRFGFNKRDISVIRVGTDSVPLEKIDFAHKFKAPTVLSLGCIRPMKRTLDQIKAFEIAKHAIPNLQMVIAGNADGEYGRQVQQYIQQSQFAKDIHIKGRVTNFERTNLMRKSHLLLATSVKEGWGLTVTEAASQGTPSAVYNVDGLRDSAHRGRTGVITKNNTYHDLAQIITSALKNKTKYDILCSRALEYSRQYNFDNSYTDFNSILSQLLSEQIETPIVIDEELA